VTVLVLCAAALAGLLAGELARLDRAALLITASAGLIGAVLAQTRPAWRLAACACIAAALGALRAEAHSAADQDALANFSGLDVQLRGEVSSTPLRTDRALRFMFTTSSVDEQPARAKVLIVAEPRVDAPEPGPGDTLEVQGMLRPDAGVPPRALINPRITLLAHDTMSPLAFGAHLRQAALDGIERGLPEPQASLAAGVLLGGSGNLSSEFRQQLRRSGLAHIVAIDGYKQVLVSASLGLLAVRLVGRPVAAAPIMLGIVGYTLLTGARPSAVRAGLMVGMATLAGVLGRLADPLTGCLLAAALMASWDPDVLLDVGFQLSFTATLGLILLWPRLRRCYRPLPSFIAEPAGITLAVTIATLPVMLSVFQSVSLVSPLAHVVAMPLLPPVLVSATLLAATAATPWPQLSLAAGWLAWLPTAALAETVRIAGSLPAAAVSTGKLPLTASIGLGLGLLGWGLWELPELEPLRSAVGRLAGRNERRLLPGAMAACSLVGLGLMLLVRPDGRLHAYVLAVAPGQAVLIRGPTGRTALVASGRLDRYALASAVAERLAVWEHSLGAVVPLDAEAEARLAPMLDRFPAETMLHPDVAERVDLEGGAVLDSYAGRAASVSFGRLWLRLLGHPPTPLADEATLLDADQDWDRDDAEIRSGPTTSAATPAARDQS
jgi:ComEC/Rec2-related protein